MDNDVVQWKNETYEAVGDTPRRQNVVSLRMTHLGRFVGHNFPAKMNPMGRILAPHGIMIES